MSASSAPSAAEDRSAFLGGALALLHLIDFDEPFGFSVVEAMACGTPVIAFDRGSMAELIDEGRTGMVVADVDRRRRRRRTDRSARSARDPRGRGRAVRLSTGWSTSTSRCTSRWLPMPVASERFRLGVNYWPSETAMGWLHRYDAAVVRRDFRRIAANGMDTVRIFLRWEDLQPAPATVDLAALADVVDVADGAAEYGVELIVTLFTGHMSGVNWIPAWATGGDDGDQRFRVISGGTVQSRPRVLRNWYSDPEVADAQARLAASVSTALAGHPAVWAWDLGNENSNCTIPPDPVSADRWLERMTSVLRASDPGRLDHGRDPHGRSRDRAHDRARPSRPMVRLRLHARLPHLCRLVVGPNRRAPRAVPRRGHRLAGGRRTRPIRGVRPSHCPTGPDAGRRAGRAKPTRPPTPPERSTP